MKREDSIAALGLLLPPSFVIGLYMYIGSFNRMLGDDYCTTYQAQHLGLFRSIWFWYRTWHGRFSANAADWLISLSGSEGYSFHTFVFLSTWIVFAVFAVKKGLDFRGYSSYKLFAALLLSVLLVFITLSLTPDIIESVFWWGGVRSYLSPFVFILLYSAFYFHFIVSLLNRNQRSIWLIISFGLAFFMGGFSETFTPVLVVLLGGMIALTGLLSKSNIKTASRLFLSAGFLGALLSLAVMLLAPGNSIRRSYFPAPPDPFTILRVASASYLTFLNDAFRSPSLLIGLVGSILGSVWLGMRINRESGIAPLRGWQIAAILVAGLFLAFGCFPTAVYATSEPPPARTLINPAFILAVCFLVSGFFLGEWLINHAPNSISLRLPLLLAAGSLIIFSSWNGFQRLYAMREEHISFAQQWDQIDAEIRSAKNSGLGEVHIPSLKNWADAEYPTDNPRYWPNICYSKYYDINVLAPPRQP